MQGVVAWQPGDQLTAPEEEMCTRVAAGDYVDRGEGPFSFSAMQAWPAEHTVRAAVLRHLLIDQARPVDPKGIRLRGVRVVGVLDLQAATLRCPLVLDRCFLDTQEPICFDHAVALEISLVNCRLPGLTGELLAARSLNLNNSTISGPLLLRDADIAGYVSCRGVQLTGRDEYGDAFGADGIKATGIYLTDGFTASGTVRLPGAEIARVLACSGAQLNGRDEDGHALIADQMTVGTVLLDAGLTAAGAISVGGAHVTGDLNCTNASLNGCNKDGNALFATQISVGGSVLLDGNFAAAGTVRMVGADIGGSLICSGARLSGANDRGYSLLANESRVGGSVFLNEGSSPLVRSACTALTSPGRLPVTPRIWTAATSKATSPFGSEASRSQRLSERRVQGCRTDMALARARARLRPPGSGKARGGDHRARRSTRADCRRL